VINWSSSLTLFPQSHNCVLFPKARFHFFSPINHIDVYALYTSTCLIATSTWPVSPLHVTRWTIDMWLCYAKFSSYIYASFRCVRQLLIVITRSVFYWLEFSGHCCTYCLAIINGHLCLIVLKTQNTFN